MDLAKKLQIPDKQGIQILNAPTGLGALAALPRAAKADAMLLFLRSKTDWSKHGGPLIEAARADRLAWVAYPKARQLDTDLDRDSLWHLVRPDGIRPVRQVSIDDVWSALRFRPA